MAPWQWELPWSWDGDWMPIFLMSLLSVCEVLQWKKSDTVFFTCSVRCCPRMLSSTSPLWKCVWRMPWFMKGLGSWKGVKKSALLAQKGTDPRVSGNFSTGTMMVPQNRDTRYARDLSAANSNLELRFCLNSIYLYKYCFGPGALSLAALVGVECLTYRYNILFQVYFWRLLDRYKTLFLEINIQNSEIYIFCLEWYQESLYSLTHCSRDRSCLSFFHTLFFSV